VTALDLLTAIGGSKSLAALDGFCKAVWSDWGAGQLSDEQAQSLAETIEARRREVRGSDTVAARVPQVAGKAKSAGRPSHFPPKRRASRSPDRRASIERRRKLAASGPMPPQLACRFTTGELAALRIIADPVRDRGACMMALGEIAARAGVCVTTARNALRQAAREGLLTIEERRRDKRPNLPNVVRIVSREWTNWIKRGRRLKSQAPASEGGGCKKTWATDKASFRSSCSDRVSRGQHILNDPPKTLKGASTPLPTRVGAALASSQTSFLSAKRVEPWVSLAMSPK
jgi:hypothetical protein